MFNLNRNKMKKLMFALCLMFGGSVVVSAQDNKDQDTTSNQYRNDTQSQSPQDQQGQGQYQDQNRERIQSTELPDAVKRSLEDQEYRGWLVNGAFKAKGAADNSAMESDSTNADANHQGDNNAVGAQGEEIYIVELKNGAETKTVRFDKDGQKIEGMDEGQNDQATPNQNDQTSPNGQNSDQSSPNGQSSQTSPNGQSSQPDQSTTTPAPDQSSQPKSTDPNKKDEHK